MSSTDKKFAQPIRVATIKDPTGTGSISVNTTGAITVPNATDTLVGRNTTDTLTNKTLSGNTATNLVNGAGTFNLNSTGTITTPNATDTLVGRDTTDTLTNKTLTDPQINIINNTSDVPTIAVDARSLYDSNELTSVEWETRFLSDSNEDISIHWEDRQLRTSATVKLDWSGTDISVNNRKITNLATPTTSTDAATKAYVDSTTSGLDVKQSVRVATTVAGTLATSFENGDTIDGITLATGNRILIKNQATGSENGIYTVNASGAPTRATDFDTDAEVTAGAFTFVEQGTVNSDTGWVLSTDNPIVVGTTSLTFTQFSSAGVITAGAGLTQSGNIFNVVAADTSITVNADDLLVNLNTTGGLETSTGVRIKSDTTTANTLAITTTADGAGTKYDPNSFSETAEALTLAAGVAGSGLALTTGVLSVNVDNSTIEIATDTLQVKDLGITNAKIANTTINLTTKVTGTLPIANGGTNSSSALNNNRIMVSSTGSIVEAAALTNGQLLIGSTGAAPVAANITAGTGISVTNGAGSITIANTALSAGDIADTQFNFANNQAAAANVTGLAFANATVRSFEALVSVFRDGTADFFEVFKLYGIQRGADWAMSVESTGDTSGIVFTITNAGQVQYTSTNNAGSTAEKMKFRAATLALEV